MMTLIICAETTTDANVQLCAKPSTIAAASIIIAAILCISKDQNEINAQIDELFSESVAFTKIVEWLWSPDIVYISLVPLDIVCKVFGPIINCLKVRQAENKIQWKIHF